ncbi:MAG: hypothetical protein AB7H88_20560 [Vicinamibacterales bacterium]
MALVATALVPAPAPDRRPGVAVGTAADAHGGLIARRVDQPSYTPPMPSDLGGAPAATITVTYTGFTAASQAAFQRAVDIWAGIITSSVPIRVSATMKPLATNVLGSAGANFYWRNFSGGVANSWYPDALADKLAGSDRNPGDFDIVANFTTDPSINWYFGTDGNPGSGQYDFVSVVLHEIGHGLGFSGSGDVSGGVGTWGSSGVPDIYDRFVKNGSGVSIMSFTSGTAALAAQLLGGNLFWNTPAADGGPISSPAKLYAPSSWESGSSYSHLDEDTYVAGNANSLMTPQISMMEAIHDPGTITREIFADMGWTVGSTTPTPTPSGPPGTPTGVAVAVNGTSSLTVTWTAPSSGTTPTSYRVDFSVTPGGASAAQVASTTTSATVNIPAGTTGTFYATVTAIAGSTAGTASSPVAFTIGSSGPGPCTTAPVAPTGVSASASGGIATVSWTASAGATSYVVQAGSASGGTNIYDANVGANTTVSASVPAGFFAFVQVRAVNACGTSAASTPVTLSADPRALPGTAFSGFRPGGR